MKQGDVVSDKGYITKAKYLRMQPAHELERRLGFRVGRLSDGWWLLLLLDMPQAAQFEFRGHTHFSGGVVQGHLPNPSDSRTSEQRLRDEGYDVDRLKQNMIRETFCLSGPDRLAKVVPVRAPFGTDDYPQGSGVPQWDLRAELRFKVAAGIQPGNLYQGNYL